MEPIPVADVALRANNPIRKIMESLRKPDIPEKPFIALSLGDPTIFGNLLAPEVLVQAVIENLRLVHSASSAIGLKRCRICLLLLPDSVVQ